ncbi:MAG: hypothetical protein ACXABO_04210 [Promethearchaeota archaeon]|jgi:hypothetical protein
MEYLESIFFLLILIVYVSTLKANTFLIIFGAAVYIILIMQLLNLEPMAILSSFLHDILGNPFGFFLLFVPLGFEGLYRGLKKILHFKRNFE